MMKAAPLGHRRRGRERAGRRAEQIAWIFLALKGYRLIDRRARTHGGELDLVMRRRRTLIFVEVKRRPTRRAGLQALHPQARDRLKKAAEGWLASRRQSIDTDCRFDVVIIAPWRWPLHIQNALAAP